MNDVNVRHARDASTAVCAISGPNAGIRFKGCESEAPLRCMIRLCIMIVYVKWIL
mgnify:CR=1 FL=1